MAGFSGHMTKVEGLSDKRRLPRVGKVRLGVKLVKGATEYPAELPFFLLPDEVARVYGFKNADAAVKRAEEMKVKRAELLKAIRANAWRLSESLKIMLPIEDTGAVFPHAYVWYGKARGAQCRGNGKRAVRYDEAKKLWAERACPCEKLKSEENPRGECSLKGHLMCLLPDVAMGGVYQIDLGSKNSVIDLLSGMDFIAREEQVGRFAMVPLLLRRIEMVTRHGGQSQIHYTLQLILHPSIDAEKLDKIKKDNNRFKMQPALRIATPEDMNPEMDTGAVVYDEDSLPDPCKTCPTREGCEDRHTCDKVAPSEPIEQQEDVLTRVRKLRTKVPKETYEAIKQSFSKAPGDTFTVEELHVFEVKLKDAILELYKKNAEEVFNE